MHSSAQMSGQYQQIGPPSQSSQGPSQHIYGTTWNQPAGAAYNSGLHLQQRARFDVPNGAYYYTPTPKWKTSTAHHQQAVSSPWPSRGGSNIRRHQVATPSNYQYINSLFQCPRNNMKRNTTYTTYAQQHRAAHWNQQGAVSVTQSAMTPSGNAGLTDNHRIQNSNLHMSQKTHYPNQLNSSHQLPLTPPAYTQEQSVKVITGTQPPSGTNLVYRSNQFVSLSDRNMVSRGKQVGSLSNMPLLIELLNCTSSPRDETISSAVDTRSTCETLTQSVIVNDSHIHSSPGRAGAKAVAVVQPLSQENDQDAGGHCSSNPIDQLAQYTVPVECSNQDKLVASQVFSKNNKGLDLNYALRIHPENPNNTSTISHSAASNDGNSDLAQYWDFVQNHSNPCAIGFEQASKIQVDQHVAPTAQQTATPEVAVSQSKNPMDGHGYAEHCQSLKRRKMTQSDKLKPGGGDINNYVVTFVQPAGSDSESHDAAPLQQSTALRFSVSPGSSEVQDTSTPVPSKSCYNVAPTSLQSATPEVVVSQSDDQGKSENPTDPKARVFELSSLPTTPWVAAKLLKFVQDAEKAQFEKIKNKVGTKMEGKDMAVFDGKMLLLKFWDGKLENLLSDLHTSWYKDLMARVKEFYRKHCKLDSVLLSQVKHGFEGQLQNYHVLKHEEVYKDPPYISSWLNITELDEIDKVFGPPCSLIHRHHTSVSQHEDIGSVSSSPVEIECEMTNTVSVQSELHPGERQKAPNTETCSTQIVSPEETESTDSSDPFCSVKICVLPPEMAKAIYEQTDKSQNMDTDIQIETVMNSSVERELLKNIDVPLNDTKPGSESPNAIEQVCCLSRWIETICGSAPLELCECQCKPPQSLKDRNDETLDKDWMSVQKDDWKNFGVIRSDSEIHSSTPGENKVKGTAKVNPQIMTYSWSELFNEQKEPNAATADDNKSDSDSDKKEKNISHTSINCSQSSIMLISEDDDEDLWSTMAENQSELDADCMQTQFESKGSTLTGSSASSEEEVEHLPVTESEISQMSHLEEHFQEAQLTSAALLETDGKQTRKSALKKTCSFDSKPDTVDRKHKRQRSHDGCFPSCTKSNKYKPLVDVHSQAVPEGDAKCRNVDADNSKTSASNVSTFQLTLFGSVAQDRQVLLGGRKKHSSSSVARNDDVLLPPKVLMVNLKPQTAPEEKSSVKGWIQEKCRSFPPTKTWCRNKPKTQKSTLSDFSGVTPKRPRTVAYTSPHKLSLSEMRTWNGNAKHSPSLKRKRKRRRKRKRTQSDKLKPGGGDMKKYAVTFEHPAVSESKHKENESCSGMPLQESTVLRFSVLPNTFNFEHGSSEMKDTSTSVPNTSVSVEGKDTSPDKIILRKKGAWLPNVERKCSHPRLPAVPKTSSLFHEFKRRYKDMLQ